MNFIKGDVVFINLNAQTYWENQTWDTDTNYNAEGYFNLTNVTNDWNVFGVQNQSGRTMGTIDDAWLIINSQTAYNTTPFLINNDTAIPNNDSLQAIVYFNNTAVTNRKYVVHPFNYTLNNLTTIDFGEVMWININATWNHTVKTGEVGFITINRSFA